MATTRTIEAHRDGPVHIETRTRMLQVVVVTDPSCRRASLEIRTDDNEGYSADVVRKAVLDYAAAPSDRKEAGLIALNTTKCESTGGGGITIVSHSGRGSSFTSINSGSGVVVTGDGSVSIQGSVSGMVMMNGKVISPGGGAGQVSRPVSVVATVPPGSSFNGITNSGGHSLSGHFDTIYAQTESGGVSHRGTARQVTALAQSGGITLGSVDVADANTMSGGVRVDRLIGSGKLRTMSGGVKVHAEPGATGSASTMSGGVTITGTGHTVTGSSMSGRVTGGYEPQAARTPTRSATGRPDWATGSSGYSAPPPAYRPTRPAATRADTPEPIQYPGLSGYDDIGWTTADF